MPQSTLEMVEEFKSFIKFVESLKDIDEEYWIKPFSEGKWSMKDVVCHIMLWDKYFYEGAIEKIKLGEAVSVKHLNFDEFNANAMEYAKTQTKDRIIAQFIEYREKIIGDIMGLSERLYTEVYIDGDNKEFIIHEYLRGFIPHDKVHENQIKDYLKSLV